MFFFITYKNNIKGDINMKKKEKEKEIIMREINIEYKEWREHLLSLYYDEDEE